MVEWLSIAAGHGENFFSGSYFSTYAYLCTLFESSYLNRVEPFPQNKKYTSLNTSDDSNLKVVDRNPQPSTLNLSTSTCDDDNGVPQRNAENESDLC